MQKLRNANTPDAIFKTLQVNEGQWRGLYSVNDINH